MKYIDLHENPTAIRIRSVQSAHSFFNGLEAILLVGLVSVILGIQVFFHREEKEKNKVFGYGGWKTDFIYLTCAQKETSGIRENLNRVGMDG